jgi:hypothetical protein
MASQKKQLTSLAIAPFQRPGNSYAFIFTPAVFFSTMKPLRSTKSLQTFVLVILIPQTKSTGEMSGAPH